MRDTEVTRSPETADRWLVMLSSGTTRAVTLDELDAEFSAERIDGRTLVLPPGEVFWASLAEVAGLDDDDSPPAKAPPVEPTSAGVANLAIDVDVGLRAPFATKRRWIRIAALPAAFAVLAAIALAASSGSDPKAEPTGAVAAPAPPRAAEAPPRAVDPPGATVTVPAPPPRGSEPTPATAAVAKASSLTDKQRRALTMKDKRRATDAAKKAKAAAPKRASRPPRSPFRQGGHPHDPLNAKL